MSGQKNVFVVGLDDFNCRMLETIRNAGDYAFHGLLDKHAVVEPESYPMETLLDEARRTLDAFPGSVDAIIGHYDFPVSTTLPILQAERGLAGPSLESVLKCEHKYWSRIEQQAALGDAPRFCAVDPFADDPLENVDVPYPFWLKPIKSFSSHLGFRIENERDFRRAIPIIREHIGRIGEPFNYVLSRVELPPEVEGVDGYSCIAEEITGGRQCTLEGYVLRGDVRIYGIVDSLRGPNLSSFSHYEYPSVLPEDVTDVMIAETCRVMEHIGLDDSPFNVEFFYDEPSGRISLLEINPRMSKSHAPLFYLVEGASHHEVAVEVALGEKPSFPRGEGEYPRAAKFMARKYGDALVEHVPNAEEVARINEHLHGVWVRVQVEEGMRLSEMRDQDSYSYEVAVVFVGAEGPREILLKYQQVLDELPFRFSDGGSVWIPSAEEEGMAAGSAA